MRAVADDAPSNPDERPDPRPTSAQPELDFDGRYRVEKLGDTWYLRGPAFCDNGHPGMTIRGDTAELVEKYRDLADLLNAVVDAERRR
jgi:hypothetical protein